jgi:hypothetical protein
LEEVLERAKVRERVEEWGEALAWVWARELEEERASGWRIDR